MEATRIINITHNDLDGVGCPIVLASMTHKMIEPHYCGYHDVEDEIAEILDNLDESVSQIFITDISMRKESKTYDRITQINAKYGYNFIYMVDHHATSQFVNKLPWAQSHEADLVTGELKCATYQLYEYLTKQGYNANESLIEFVTLVNLWDTWRWVTDYPADNPRVEASQLNMVQAIYGKKKFLADYIRKIKNCSPMFGPIENAIIECKMHEIEKDVQDKDRELIVTDFYYQFKPKYLEFIKNYLNSNHITDKDYLMKTKYRKKFKIGVVYANRNVSDVGNKLAELHPELDFIMLISMPKTVSFRAVKDLDVPLGIVANYITGKGGGHPKSAGGVLGRNISERTLFNILTAVK